MQKFPVNELGFERMAYAASAMIEGFLELAIAVSASPASMAVAAVYIDVFGHSVFTAMLSFFSWKRRAELQPNQCVQNKD